MIRKMLLSLMMLGFLIGNAAAAPFAYIGNHWAGTIDVIDLAANMKTDSINVGTYPIGVAVNPLGSKVYVALDHTYELAVIDTATKAISKIALQYNDPLCVLISPDGSRVYVTDGWGWNLAVIDTSTNKVIKNITVGSHPGGMAITPSGDKLYVANNYDGEVAVIDTATYAISKKIKVGLGPNGVDITPDGKRIYVTNGSYQDVSVIDTETDEVVGSPITVGTNPNFAAVNFDGTKVYISNPNGNSISVIDTATNTLIKNIDVGSSPGSLAFHPSGDTAYVVHWDRGYISVIDTIEDTLAGTIGGLTYSSGNISYGKFTGPMQYEITASSDAGGSISPSGSSIISYGGSVSFAITPDAGYVISDVLVDGVSVGSVDSYTFSDITTSHTISAFFEISNGVPTANAGLDQSVECAGPEGASVTLDGSGSSDPDGDSLTYTWTWNGGSASGVKPAVTMPYGSTIVRLTVDDGNGHASTDPVTINVSDTTAPVAIATFSGTQNPDGSYSSDVVIAIGTTDSCTGVSELRYWVDGAESVANAGSAEATISTDGTHVVSYASTDNAGNSASGTFSVVINKPAPIDNDFSDAFDGASIDLSKWEISSPLGNSTVSMQGDSLHLPRDATPRTLSTPPGLFGPGAGVGSVCRLSGDFDIQVDFSNMSYNDSYDTSFFFNVFQDEANQLHIKKHNYYGIQTVSKFDGSWGETWTTEYATSGAFRIIRSGSVIRTYYDIGQGQIEQFSRSGAFTGDVTVALMLGSTAGSVDVDSFRINSGTVTCAKPDFVVTSVAGSTSPKPNETVTITAGLKNQGSATGSFRAGVYLSADSTITTADTYLGEMYVSDLAAGSETTATASVKIPSNAGGNYYIGVIADYDNAVQETDESNNSNSYSVSITAMPDLVVKSISGATSAKNDETVTVNFTVKNQGNAKTGTTFLSRLYISSDPTITTGDTLLGYLWFGDIAAGGESSGSISGQIPLNISGTYYLGVIVDEWANVAESDETNNTGSYKIAIGLVTPTANAGADQSVECAGAGGASVTLDGSGSSDPDGDALTYTWTWNGGSASGVKPTVTMPYGSTIVTLTVDDGNGHTASDTVTITIGDHTAPVTDASVIGVLGDNGWYVSDADVTLTSTDSCTGVKEIHYIITDKDGNSTEYVSSGDIAQFTVSKEGSNIVTYWAVDNAGNYTAQASTAPIYRDPASAGGGTPGGTSRGYYSSCVSVTLQSTGENTYYSADGGATWTLYTGAFQVCDTMNITYGTPSSGGNIETPKTITINIDKTPPSITAAVSPAPDAQGWNGTDVTVTFTCTDDISGVASCPDPVTVAAEGAVQVVSGTAYDVAGNSATARVTINIDKTPPSITAAANPSANAYGWNNSDVTVSYTCSDSGAGIAACSSPVAFTNEGAGQTATGTAVDKLGRTASTSVVSNMDKTAPTITAAVSPQPNSLGWNNTDVTVTFTCSDSLSGVAACPSPITVSAEGAGQVISGTVYDKAGNAASVSVTVNVDKTSPVITINGAVDGAVYTLCGKPSPSYAASDALSEIAAQDAVQEGDGVGRQTYTVTAADNAGNTATAVVSYTIEYTFGAFEPPVSLGKPFKLGSTIPVKFSLSDGCGVDVTKAVARLTLQMYSGETPEGDPIEATSNVPDSGNTFRHTDGHYIYNLSTDALRTGKYLAIVTLDDGTSKTAVIQLK